MNALRDGSLPFDRAVAFYQRTRRMPRTARGPVADAFLSAAHIAPGAHVFEPGIGTGRVGSLLAAEGLQMYGLDLSRPMLAWLAHDATTLTEPPRLCEATMTRIPFPSAHFDAAAAVHIFHLVGPWQAALDEIQRVLKPGARLVIGAQAGTYGEFHNRLYAHWMALAAARGVTGLQPGVGRDELEAELARRYGPPTGRYSAAREEVPLTLRFFLDEIIHRIHTPTWDVSDTVFTACLHTITAWLEHQYGPRDRAFTLEWCFEWTAWQMP